MASVIVYSTKTCPYCDMAKEYLKKKNVPYVEVDVGSDQKAAEAMIERSGEMGVPQIDIDGQLIVGFDRAAIDAALSKRKA